MGSRGAFQNVEMGDFTFTENGKSYSSVGTVDNVKVLIKTTQGSVKAPEFSHTENRMYAIIQNGELKHLTYYDENHKQARSIDFGHRHNGVQPHVHIYLNHDRDSPGISPTEEKLKLADKIRRRFGIK